MRYFPELCAVISRYVPQPVSAAQMKLCHIGCRLAFPICIFFLRQSKRVQNLFVVHVSFHNLSGLRFNRQQKFEFGNFIFVMIPASTTATETIIIIFFFFILASLCSFRLIQAVCNVLIIGIFSLFMPFCIILIGLIRIVRMCYNQIITKATHPKTMTVP